MKAHVINLPRSTDRREHVVTQMAQLGIPYDFVDAVEGRAMSSQERAELVDESAVAEHPHWLTPGTIGCTLSHRAAYQQILDSGDEVGFVVEDDIVLPPGTAELLDELAAHMHGREAVLLYYRSFEPCTFSDQDAVELPGWGRLLYPLDVRQPITTAAYLITREACEPLVDLVVPVRAAADSWGFFHDHGAVERLRCVVPRPAGVRTEFKSTIDYVSATSPRVRLTTAISRHRIFPFHQLLTLNRRRVEKRMTGVRVVSERSPMAAADTGKDGA
jgi:glycosyl transferase, family 25